MASCLICSNLLLRQVRGGKPVMYCRTCRVEYESHQGFALHAHLSLKEPEREDPLPLKVYPWQASVVESSASVS